MTPEVVMGDPTVWLAETMRAVIAMGLRSAIVDLAWAICFAAFMIGLYEVFNSYGKFLPLMLRLMVALVIISGVEDQRTWIYNTWAGAYTWANNAWATEIDTELATATANVATLTLPFAGILGLTKMGLTTAAKRSAINGAGKLAAEGGEKAVGKALSYLNWVSWLFAPLIGFYAMMIYTSGFIAIVGMIFLPLSGVLVMLPQGVSWLARWFGAYLTALFTVVLLPVTFKIAIRQGMIRPMESMAATMQSVADDFNAKGSFGWDDVGKIWLSPVAYLWGATDDFNYFAAFGQLFAGWLLSLGILAIGMVIGTFIILNVQKHISGFIGSFGSGSGVPSFRARSGGGGGGGSITNNTTNTTNQTAVIQNGGGGEGGNGGSNVSVEKTPRGALASGSAGQLPPAGGTRRG